VGRFDDTYRWSLDDPNASGPNAPTPDPET